MSALNGIMIDGEWLGNNVVINTLFRNMCSISPRLISSFIKIISQIDIIEKTVSIENFNFINNKSIKVKFSNNFISGNIIMLFKNSDGDIKLDEYKLLVGDDINNPETVMTSDNFQDRPEFYEEPKKRSKKRKNKHGVNKKDKSAESEDYNTDDEEQEDTELQADGENIDVDEYRERFYSDEENDPGEQESSGEETEDYDSDDSYYAEDEDDYKAQSNGDRRGKNGHRGHKSGNTNRTGNNVSSDYSDEYEEDEYGERLYSEEELDNIAMQSVNDAMDIDEYRARFAKNDKENNPSESGNKHSGSKTRPGRKNRRNNNDEGFYNDDINSQQDMYNQQGFDQNYYGMENQEFVDPNNPSGFIPQQYNYPQNGAPNQNYGYPPSMYPYPYGPNMVPPPSCINENYLELPKYDLTKEGKAEIEECYADFYEENMQNIMFNGMYPNGFPGGFPGGFPNGFPGGFPNGFPGGFPNGFPGGFPNGFPNGMPNFDPNGQNNQEFFNQNYMSLFPGLYSGNSMNNFTQPGEPMTLEKYLAMKKEAEEKARKKSRSFKIMGGNKKRVKASSICEDIFLAGDKIYRWCETLYLQD